MTRTTALMLSFFAVSLHAGAAQGADPPGSALIGTWEAETGTCEGDNFVRYNADQTFGGYDFTGRWRLEGKSLITVVTQRAYDDDDGEVWRAVDPPEENATVVISLTERQLVERWADGSVHRLHKCP